MHRAEPGVDQAASGCDGRRIAIQRDEPTVRAETRQDQPAVPSPSKSAIDINTVRPDGQRIDRLIEKNGDVRGLVFMVHLAACGARA